MSSDHQNKDTPGIILAKIFKTLIYELGVNLERYQYLISNVIKQFKLDNTYKVSNLINGITKEVFNDTISWKVFVKALVFLGTTKFTIFLLKDDKSPMVFHTINLSDKDMLEKIFCFTNKEPEDPEEVKLGLLLREMLDKVIEANAPNISYTDAIYTYIENLKKTNKNFNKSLKGNLIKELRKETVTWKVFIKALIVYGITNPVIGVTIYDRFNKHHTVSFTIYLDHTLL